MAVGTGVAIGVGVGVGVAVGAIAGTAVAVGDVAALVAEPHAAMRSRATAPPVIKSCRFTGLFSAVSAAHSPAQRRFAIWILAAVTADRRRP